MIAMWLSFYLWDLYHTPDVWWTFPYCVTAVLAIFGEGVLELMAAFLLGDKVADRF